MDAGDKRKHKTLTLQTKLEILRKMDKGEALTDLAKFYGVGRSTIFDIRSKRETIENYMKASGGLGKRKTLRLELYPDLEEALFEWFLEEPCRHKRMTGPAIQEKATSLYRDMYGKDDFRASSGWLSKFRKRLEHRISVATTPPSTGSNFPAQSITQEIQRAMHSRALNAEQVYSVGEAELFWKAPPGRRDADGGTEHETVKKCKERLILVTCANSKGTHKLRLISIGKSSLKDDMVPVGYKVQKKGCFTAEVLKEWFHETFVPEVEQIMLSNGLANKALLVLDDTLDPGCELQSECRSVEAMFLPLSATQIQPMDEDIAQLLRTKFRKKIIADASCEGISLSRKLRNVTLGETLLAADEAWATVPAVAIESSWQKLWSPYTVDEDDYEPEFLVPITGAIRAAVSASPGEFTSRELLDWIAGGCEEPLSMSEDEEHTKTEIEEFEVTMKEERTLEGQNDFE